MAKSTFSSSESHAVVIGGSMAGLLTARILADFLDGVTIIELDDLPDAPQTRRGTPQSLHYHVLLREGRRILELLFPGLDEQLAVAGVSAVDWANNVDWFSVGAQKPHFTSGVVTWSLTRPLLEWTVRQRVSQLPQIVWQPRRKVVGLEFDPERQQVTGVQVRTLEDDSISDTVLTADLVIDASGRLSQAPQWLQKIGFHAPVETIVNSYLGYASRCYEQVSTASSQIQAIVVQATPPEGKRGAVLAAVEEGRWILTLAGAGRDYPPTDEVGWLNFVESLPVPTIAEAIRNAQPLSPITAYRRTENRLRHYERLQPYPDHFLIVGDATCAFNPVYGQGMTVAAQGAMLLRQCLQRWQSQSRNQRSWKGLARDFQRRLAQVNGIAWQLATNEDYRYRETEGPSPSWMTQVLHRYMDEILQVSSYSPSVHQGFLEVVHLMKPPLTLLAPSILLQVLGLQLRKIAQAPLPATSQKLTQS